MTSTFTSDSSSIYMRARDQLTTTYTYHMMYIYVSVAPKLNGKLYSTCAKTNRNYYLVRVYYVYKSTYIYLSRYFEEFYLTRANIGRQIIHIYKMI